MKDRPMNNIQDEGMKEHLRFIYENAADNDIIPVSATPTTDSLRPKDAPVSFDSKMWFNIQGSLFSIPLTAE